MQSLETSREMHIYHRRILEAHLKNTYYQDTVKLPFPSGLEILEENSRRVEVMSGQLCWHYQLHVLALWWCFRRCRSVLVCCPYQGHKRSRRSSCCLYGRQKNCDCKLIHGEYSKCQSSWFLIENRSQQIPLLFPHFI